MFVGRVVKVRKLCRESEEKMFIGRVMKVRKL